MRLATSERWPNARKNIPRNNPRHQGAPADNVASIPAGPSFQKVAREVTIGPTRKYHHGSRDALRPQAPLWPPPRNSPKGATSYCGLPVHMAVGSPSNLLDQWAHKPGKW
jgi:hypothetical protein